MTAAFDIRPLLPIIWWSMSIIGQGKMHNMFARLFFPGIQVQKLWNNKSEKIAKKYTDSLKKNSQDKKKNEHAAY